MAYHLSVFVENQPGKLEKITRALADAGQSIRAISMASAGEFGVVRILVPDPERGLAALKAAHLTVTRRRILVALIDDRPGALHELLGVLSSSGVNVEDCYGFVLEQAKRAAIVFEVEKVPEAERLLSTKVRLVPDAEIYRL